MLAVRGVEDFMAHIEFEKKTSEFLVDINFNEDITFKVDTGAVNTVISLSMLEGDIVKRNLLKLKLECMKVNRKEFIAVGGQKLTGVWVCADKVVVDDLEVDKFYYCVLIDCEKPVALLGNDFIAACTFTHSAGKDIIVTRYDSDIQEGILRSQGVECSALCSLEELVNV